jgi:hypothetical protein
LVVGSAVVAIYLLFLSLRPAVAADINECAVTSHDVEAVVNLHNRSDEYQQPELWVNFEVDGLMLESTLVEYQPLAPDARQTVQASELLSGSEWTSWTQSVGPNGGEGKVTCKIWRPGSYD